jgi:sugar lactone lactonase YvrE
MHSTIDVIKSVNISGIPTATCNTSDGCIAVGDGNGHVSIFNIDGELTGSYSVEGKVTGLVFIQKNLIVGSSLSGISIFSDSSKFHIPNSGCEIIVVSGVNFLVSDGSDSLYCFNPIGELQW